jgi:hypothetical protein
VAPGTAQESDHRHKAPAGSFGGAQKLPSGRWKAWYEVEGHRVTPGHTFPNKAQADAWLSDEWAKRRAGTWAPRAGKLTLRQFVDEEW